MSTVKKYTPTIFVSPYRNFALRYILYTDIISQLTKVGFKVVVFVKDNDVGYYREKFKDRDLIVQPVLFNQCVRSLRATRLARMFTTIRKCMSGSRADMKNSTDDFRIYQYGLTYSRGILGRLVEFPVIRLVSALGNRFKFIRRGIVNVESRLYPGRMYDEYFERYAPRLLITSSLGYMIDPYFMRAARRYKCKVVSIIHGWDNTSTKDYRGADPTM